MQVFDNITSLIYEDLKNELQKGAKLSIASACFQYMHIRSLRNN